MYVCQVCKINLDSIKKLMKHLKLQHSFSVFDKYICKQPLCVREFQSARRFEQHLLRDHPFEGCKEQNIHTFPNAVKLQSVHVPNIDLENRDNSISADEKLANTFDSSNFKFKEIQNAAASSLSYLYNNNTMTRQHVQIVVDVISNLVENIMSMIENKVHQSLNTLQAPAVMKQEYASFLNQCKSPFCGLDTEYKRIQYFSQKGCYIEPVSYIIGQIMESRKINNIFTLIPNNVTGQFISVMKVLKAIFEIPNILKDISDYMEQVTNDSHCVSNIIQSELWKNLSHNFYGKLVLPLIIYYDEFETNNPLGGHAGVHKMGAVYFSLPCMPPEARSKLDNIFLTLLFLNKDREVYGNEATFRPLINELQILEKSGLVTKEGIHIYIKCALVIGDNLGVHEICGFVKSFVANYPCRFCKASLNQIRYQTVEDKQLLRTVREYTNDLQKNDVSVTGLTEICVWNQLDSFHILQNMSCDIMHDVFEGVCQYDMSKLILHFIQSNLFTLEDLNDRIGTYDFGPEEGNHPPFLKIEKLKRYSLGLSASETITFVIHFSLIIGHKVPENNDFWNLYICLNKIVTVLLIPFFTSHCIEYLDALVTEHHQLYLYLFKDTLKPKHHFLLHYARVMKSVGPLINIWCMRYEAKHRQSKIAAHISSSRRNLPLTLAIKHQLKLCYRLFQNIDIKRRISFGKELSMQQISKLPNYRNFEVFLSSVTFHAITWINIKGIYYKPGFILNILREEIFPFFGKIELIFADKDEKIFFIMQCMDTIRFCSHVQGYEVKYSNKWKCVAYDSLCNILSSHIISISNILYIILKE